MDVLDLGSEAVPSDASPWAATLEMIFATVQGPAPPAPMQLEVVRQARALVEQIALAPLAEANPEAVWIAIVHPGSVVLLSGERSLVAHLQFGSAVTLDIGIPDQAAWSILWNSPGADAESLLSGVLSGAVGSSSARPAVRIGIFQGDRRVAETSFNEAGGWQDELDDQALTDELNRRLEEAGRGVEAPEEALSPGPGAPPAPQSSPVSARGVSGVSGGVLAGAAAVTAVAAAAIAREMTKKRVETEPPSPPSPTPPSPPPSPVSSPLAERQWYYMQGPRQEGPIEEPVIRQLIVQGIVTGGTMVWNESLTNWTTAAEAGLAPVPPAGPKLPPPPLPSAVAPPPAPPAAQREAIPSVVHRACPGCGAETRPGARFCGSCGHRLD